jgi:hypothetical protein
VCITCFSPRGILGYVRTLCWIVRVALRPEPECRSFNTYCTPGSPASRRICRAHSSSSVGLLHAAGRYKRWPKMAARVLVGERAEWRGADIRFGMMQAVCTALYSFSQCRQIIVCYYMGLWLADGNNSHHLTDYKLRVVCLWVGAH